MGSTATDTGGNPYGDFGKNHDPSGIPEGGLEQLTDNEYDENPFHNVGAVNKAVWGGLEEMIVCVLDLNCG